MVPDAKEQVLRFFENPTSATKVIVEQMLEMPDEVILEALIQRNRMPLTNADQALLEAAKREARARIVRGRHHLFSYILGESGNFYAGIQETYSRDAEIETCAEVGAINSLDLARDKPRTAITMHYMPIAEREDGGATSIVPPCLRCAGRLRHLYIRHDLHDFGIIVFHNDAEVKVSVKIIHLFRYPHGYNGDGSSKFG